MKVYVINLDRRPDRLRDIAEKLASIGVGFERISAVDGRKINPKRNVNRFLASLYSGPDSNMLAAVGCYLSHRSIWQRMVRDGVTQALILEDDADPVSWDENIMHVRLSDLKLDMLRLGSNKLKNIVTQKPIKASGHFLLGRSLVYESTFGTCAYLMSIEGAKKCLVARKYWFPVDHFHLWKNLYGLNNALLVPRMFVPSQSKSDIVYENRRLINVRLVQSASASMKRKLRRLAWGAAVCYATCLHRRDK